MACRVSRFSLLIAAIFSFVSGPALAEDITIAEYGEFPLYTTLYIAAEKGLFKEEGLNVRIVPAGGDEKVFAALLRGDAQFGVGDPTFVAIAGERGQPGRIVLSLLQKIPQWALTKNAKIPEITRPEQLKGLSVATYPAPSTSYTLQKWLYQMGNVEPKIVQLTYGSLIAGMESGRADIILEYEPVASMAEAHGARRIYTLSTFFPDFFITGVSALPDYVKDNPATVAKVVRSFLRAAKYLDTNRAESIDLLAKRFPSFPKDALARGIEKSDSIGTFSKDGIVTKAGWEGAIKLRRDVGDLKGDAPFETYVINSFAETEGAKLSSGVHAAPH